MFPIAMPEVWSLLWADLWHCWSMVWLELEYGWQYLVQGQCKFLTVGHGFNNNFNYDTANHTPAY